MKKLYNGNLLPLTPFKKTKKKLGLYPVVDSVLWIKRLLRIGVSVIQLRIKNKNNEELKNDIKNAVVLGKKYNAFVFINDYYDLAIKYGAYGVHLGQEDLLVSDLLTIHKNGLRLGISTHNKNELIIAKYICPSYISIGHIFPTKTKKMLSFPQGLKTLKTMVKSTSNYSTVAIGGISVEKVLDVLSTGVGGISLVSAITKVNNWDYITKTLLKLIENKKL
ncbi:thiamine phosphate synthase [Candidatus Providencia siddallii]|uniref:Thiamine-phosphate synthase n=1 Tax=Candidatus Providencia siddallii TaxID=1715285 RepID=A0ABM9NNL5_9GAMM